MKTHLPTPMTARVYVNLPESTSFEHFTYAFFMFHAIPGMILAIETDMFGMG